MTRHEMRECIFCLLFQNEFYTTEEFDEQMGNFLENFHFPEEHEISDKDEQEVRDKVARMLAFLPDIDEKISSSTKGWKIDRIAKAELAILRLAVYEALYDDAVPVGVAVNEAVELAKQYGDDNGAAFVNGILGKIVNE
ncbi:MAG: transcription antitermination factor NusB [Eubacterium sp.]|nr:transcription antitermination factor NusB [Eubacterium sp.]